MSIVCLGFSSGLSSTVADLLFVWRRPSLLLRSFVAMLVIMPVVAVTLAAWLDARKSAEFVLIAMAMSPVPPLLPRRNAQAGGRQAYAISLMATLALLAIVTIPVSVKLLAHYSGRPLALPASRIAWLAFISVLLPLTAGIAVRRWTTVAERLVRPTNLLGLLLLTAGCVLLLSATWQGIWGATEKQTVIMVVAFVAIGLLVGRVLGGPDRRESTVLGLSAACRHPAITLSIASANYPTEPVGAIVLLYMLVGLVFLTPYVQWSGATLAEHSR